MPSTKVVLWINRTDTSTINTSDNSIDNVFLRGMRSSIDNGLSTHLLFRPCSLLLTTRHPSTFPPYPAHSRLAVCNILTLTANNVIVKRRGCLYAVEFRELVFSETELPLNGALGDYLHSPRRDEIRSAVKMKLRKMLVEV